MAIKKCMVWGAGGFIGSHLVRRLAKERNIVTGVDLKAPEFNDTYAQRFIIGDLRSQDLVNELMREDYDEIYQLAADMGGAGFVFSGENDADIMHNSAQINLNLVSHHKQLVRAKTKVFYSSSACVYNQDKQSNLDNLDCSEASAYPANPDSDYGWEKLFSERLYSAFARNYGLDIRIARFHNIFGPYGSWNDGREKAPAAFCRKVAEAKARADMMIEMWGDGEQTRSFLYIDECINGVLRLMGSDYTAPVNIGSDEMVSINQLVRMISIIADYPVDVEHIAGPLGVRGRSSDNKLIKEVLGWKPDYKLADGLVKTYGWIEEQVKNEIAP